MIAQTATLNLAGKVYDVRINNAEPQMKIAGQWVFFNTVRLRDGRILTSKQVLKLIIDKTV